MAKEHKKTNVELPTPVEFEWDDWNIKKNWEHHKVTVKEMEQSFLDESRKIFSDAYHSDRESRYIAIGMAENGRVLYSVFTIRGRKVRIISSRDLNYKERNLYL